jgi:hypothetical protein
MLPAPVVPIDVTEHWAAGAINRLAGGGIMGGYPDGTFKPNNHINRAELASTLVRALNITPGNPGELHFSDKAFIPFWAQSAVAATVKEGLFKGYPNSDGSVTFKADRFVTRTEMAVITSRIIDKRLGPVASANLRFIDAHTIPTWARSDVGKAVAENVVGGYPDDTFRGGNNVTRAETASMTVRLIDLINK